MTTMTKVLLLLSIVALSMKMETHASMMFAGSPDTPVADPPANPAPPQQEPTTTTTEAPADKGGEPPQRLL